MKKSKMSLFSGSCALLTLIATSAAYAHPAGVSYYKGKGQTQVSYFGTNGTKIALCAIFTTVLLPIGILSGGATIIGTCADPDPSDHWNPNMAGTWREWKQSETTLTSQLAVRTFDDERITVSYLLSGSAYKSCGPMHRYYVGYPDKRSNGFYTLYKLEDGKASSPGLTPEDGTLDLSSDSADITFTTEVAGSNGQCELRIPAGSYQSLEHVDTRH